MWYTATAGDENIALFFFTAMCICNNYELRLVRQFIYIHSSKLGIRSTWAV
jgi:hypothetical protein